MARYYRGLCLRRVEEYRDDRSSNESGEVRDQSRAMRRESSTGDGRAPAGLLSGTCSLLWRAGNGFPANHRKTEVRVAGGRKIAGPRVSIRPTAGRATQSASRRWPSQIDQQRRHYLFPGHQHWRHGALHQQRDWQHRSVGPYHRHDCWLDRGRGRSFARLEHAASAARYKVTSRYFLFPAERDPGRASWSSPLSIRE